MSHGGGGNGIAQIAFRGRNDDGGEISATPIAGINENWTQRPDRNFRYRIMIDRQLLTTFNTFWFLVYSHNGGNFVQVDFNTPVVRGTFSPHYENGIDCTQQLGSGAFISDNNGMVENDGMSIQQLIFPGDEPKEAEAEWCLEIVGDAVKDGDSIVLKGTLLAGALYNLGYFELADITVDKPVTIRRTLMIE